MSIINKITGYLGRLRTKAPKGYPTVVARTGRDAESSSYMSPKLRPYQTIPASYPFQLHDIIDVVSVLDPYVSRFVHQTVALGNPGHKLYLKASSEARANEALKICNEFAARCFPLAGGMDGITNGMLHQLARAGACCVEWVPDKTFTRIERGYLLPIKSLRFRYADDKGTLELIQQWNGKDIVLQPLQTMYHGLVLRDTNPYPIPPIASALEACSTHRSILAQIKTWVEKVSALGIMTATATPPPRVPGQDQAAYDATAQGFLNALADTVANNMQDGLAVGYDNVKFTFNSTQAGAQGAKDLLQIVVQGMFAALQRDPIFFGWNMGSTETLAKIVYQEMLQSLKVYQTGPKRLLEGGHRLNLALNGVADVSVSVSFKADQTVDTFKEAEADMMHTQAIIQQYEWGIITVDEARKLLGHEDKGVEAGAYVAAFNRENGNVYELERYKRVKWSGADLEVDATPEKTGGTDEEEDQNAA